MDRRQKKTRQAIFNAFTDLLEKKPFSAVTVSEIIAAADVGRSTFYTHFETKDDLLRALCAEIFEHVFSDAPVREQTHDFSSRPRDLRAELTHILYHLRDSRRYVKGILACESGEIFMRAFRDYLKGVPELELSNVPANVPKDYLLNHLVCDFAETVRWWMKNESYTPEEISGFFLATAPFLSPSHAPSA